MEKLSRSNLMSLEQYAEVRPGFRAQVMAHKLPRRISVGRNATLYFEDFLTMKYQVQEMLRAERIFEVAGIEEEVEAYNPLIPDGSNLKATFMIEYPDVAERRSSLARLGGVEETIWLRAEGAGTVYAIANEDLPRTNDGKASAVHFLRFELGSDTIAAFKAGRPVRIGIDHEELAGCVTLTPEQVASLVADLD